MSGIKIIGEIGLNHNGSLITARKLIDMAKGCGCDAVKFQKRDIDTVYTREFLDSTRESPFGTTQREQKNGLEFGEKEYDAIDRHCKDIGIAWFASPWDIESLYFLRKYETPYNKIASPMLTHRDMVSLMSGERKHILASTGMSTFDQIDWAVNCFKRAGVKFTLMHCVSLYPCPDHLCNINMVTTLKERYGCPVGYSGHEVGITPSLLAVSLGAEVIERHITLDRSMYGSDQSASLEKRGLEILVREAREISKVMGDGGKTVLQGEFENANKLRYWQKGVYV